MTLEEHACSKTERGSEAAGAYDGEPAGVSAHGTGCPTGTWNPSITEDGKALIVTLSRHKKMVNPGEAFAIRDCTLSVDLRTPERVTFAVTGFRYEGDAVIDQSEMNLNQSIAWSKEFAEDERPSSTCATESRLNFIARAFLRNTPSKTGSAYANFGESDVPAFKIALDWKPCDGSAAR